MRQVSWLLLVVAGLLGGVLSGGPPVFAAEPRAGAAGTCAGLADALGYEVHPLITRPGLAVCARDGRVHECTEAGWRATAEGCGGAVAARTWYVDDLDAGPGDGSAANPFRHVQDALDAARDGDRVVIRNGRYEARPRPYTDPTCGNCADPGLAQRVSLGFYVLGKALHVTGESRDGVVLRTGAQYGFVFEHAGVSSLEGLTLTGGRRGADDRSTDAALLARATRLTVHGVKIEDNLEVAGGGGPARDVGIAGIVGREGATLDVRRCLLRRNSWDGIALYRGATAEVSDSDITAGPRPPGRGAGLGVTWDASLTARRNRISAYAKGVIAVGASRSLLVNNIIRDGELWGLGVAGDAVVRAYNNVFARMGYGTYVFSSRDPSALDLRNNVYYGNRYVGIAWSPGCRPRLAYNGVFGNGLDLAECDVACVPQAWRDVAPGSGVAGDGDAGNLRADPRFTHPAGGDFVLGCGSPLRDAGDPAPAFRDADRSRNDLGAHGGPAAAALPGPVCGAAPGGRGRE